VVDKPLELLASDLLGGGFTILGGLLLPSLTLLLVSFQACVFLVLRLHAATLTTILLASLGCALAFEGRSQLEFPL